jgi:acetyl esterase/lipase
LASQGVVVVSITYRLSPKHAFPDHAHDVLAALQWVRRHAAQYGGDQEFICVCGSSAGAHLAALASTTHAQTHVQACISLYGVYSFHDEAFRRYFAKVVMKQRDYDPTVPNAEVDAAMPIHWLHHNNGPTVPFLLLHGSNDNLIPCDTVYPFLNALKEIGCDGKKNGDVWCFPLLNCFFTQ